MQIETSNAFRDRLDVVFGLYGDVAGTCQTITIRKDDEDRSSVSYIGTGVIRLPKEVNAHRSAVIRSIGFKVRSIEASHAGSIEL